MRRYLLIIAILILAVIGYPSLTKDPLLSAKISGADETLGLSRQTFQHSSPETTSPEEEICEPKTPEEIIDEIIEEDYEDCQAIMDGGETIGFDEGKHAECNACCDRYEEKCEDDGEAGIDYFCGEEEEISAACLRECGEYIPIFDKGWKKFEDCWAGCIDEIMWDCTESYYYALGVCSARVAEDCKNDICTV